MRYIQSELLLDLPQFDNSLARWGAREAAGMVAGKALDTACGGLPVNFIAGKVLGVNAKALSDSLMNELGI